MHDQSPVDSVDLGVVSLPISMQNQSGGDSVGLGS